MNQKILEFLSLLQKYPENGNVHNIFSKTPQKNNFEAYLKYITSKNPKILAIGEAPGHLGCNKTGIPFASGNMIHESECFIELKKDLIYDKDDKEQTAKIVFDYLPKEYFDKIIFWNIFPFHPHEKDNDNSNRTPNLEEVKQTINYLDFFINNLNIETIICIGGKSYDGVNRYKKSNNKMNTINITKVRHPGRGGKNKFLDQFNEILQYF